MTSEEALQYWGQYIRYERSSNPDRKIYRHIKQVRSTEFYGPWIVSDGTGWMSYLEDDGRGSFAEVGNVQILTKDQWQLIKTLSQFR